MTDERASSMPPSLPGGDTHGGPDSDMREAAPRNGFAEGEPGTMPRGPRRSRYGRRRGPGEGPAQGEPYQGGYQERGGHPQERGYQERGGYQERPARMADPTDDVESFLPSFIAGPSSAPANGAVMERDMAPPAHGYQAPQHQAPQHQQHQAPQHQPQHQQAPQHHQPHQHQPRHAQQHQPQHQPQGQQSHVHQYEPEPVVEEISPEVQAAAAAFVAWEESNPQLKGLLICSPTVRRGEPIVRGTRIPARILAAIAKMGSTVEEMIRDYPQLTKDGLDAALAFTAANPRQPPRG